MLLNVSIDLDKEGTYEDSIAELIRDSIRDAIDREIKRIIKENRDLVDRTARKLVSEALSDVAKIQTEELKAKVREKLKEYTKP